MYPIPDLLPAAQEDAATAAALLESLLASGRKQHPALPHLSEVALADPAPDRVLLNASVAFETAVRVDVSKRFAKEVEAGRIPEDLAPMLTTRKATDWEGGGKPYTEVNWRAAVARATTALRNGDYCVPDETPGAAGFKIMQKCYSSPAVFTRAIEGPVPRSDVLDIVAATGNFLAQAMPGYCDLDMLFRVHRDPE